MPEPHPYVGLGHSRLHGCPVRLKDINSVGLKKAVKLIHSCCHYSTAPHSMKCRVYTLNSERNLTLTSSIPFRDALANLLAERKLLRKLSNDLTHFRVLGDREQAQKIEQRISDLVQEPLNLSKLESKAPHFLAEAVQNLFASLNDLRFYDEPGRYWEQYTPVPNVGLVWPRALQERLTTLCGPLDVTVSEMLAGAS